MEDESICGKASGHPGQTLKERHYETDGESSPGSGSTFPEEWYSRCLDEELQEMQHWASNEGADNVLECWEHFLGPFEIGVMAAASKRCLEISEDIKQRQAEIGRRKGPVSTNEVSFEVPGYRLDGSCKTDVGHDKGGNARWHAGEPGGCDNKG